MIGVAAVFASSPVAFTALKMIGGVYLLAERKIWLSVLVHGLVNTISLTSVYFGVTPG